MVTEAMGDEGIGGTHGTTSDSNNLEVDPRTKTNLQAQAPRRDRSAAHVLHKPRHGPHDRVVGPVQGLLIRVQEGHQGLRFTRTSKGASQGAE